MRKDLFDWKFLRNVLIKTLLLFVGLNLFLVCSYPLSGLGKLSFYNLIFPGRQRFPFGENSQEAYNLSLYNVDAMFASQALTGNEKAEDEFRVFIIGDSATWGTLLKPGETLSAYLNEMGLINPEGKQMRFYNLGYPTLSLFKDIMLLEEAKSYNPDQIIWQVTLEAFPLENQLSTPLVANNPSLARALIKKYNLEFDEQEAALVKTNFWDRTVFGQRRALADLFRLQIYGIMWAATGVDQVYPENYPPAELDYDEDISFHSWEMDEMPEAGLAFGLIEAGKEIAGDIPLLIVNEPILISSGENSDLHYNFFYPRWAYDQYRSWMLIKAEELDWDYLDVWDQIDPAEFTNSAIHLTPQGSAQLAELIARELDNE